ncbi:hypothetical protein [Bradyrhizobium sp. McL0616]|uniref:hypothetical protein n=1 Tax=Bradyrhizobium sp. McL0616 TaxID=3415674 RepID=UPI003CE8A14A
MSIRNRKQGYESEVSAHTRSFVLSEEIPCQTVPKRRSPELAAMPTAAECRILASAFKLKATEAGVPARTATLMKNISRSFSGLASQLEMLADTPSRETKGATKA